jgi:hypothetical protein
MITVFTPPMLESHPPIRFNGGLQVGTVGRVEGGVEAP